MDLMEDPTFKTKYHKHKLRVKLWERGFMEKFGRKPNKNDIKVADITTREAYKIYWTLKTRALEETLTEITFCKDSLENMLPNNSLSNFITNPENKEHKNEKILTISNSIDIKNSYPNDYLPKIVSSSPNLTKKVHIKGVWGQDLNLNQNYIKNDQGDLIGRSSSFQLSQKMFKSLSFSKRNPRKSLSLTKLHKSKIELDTFCNQTKKYKPEKNKDYKIPDILESSFDDNLKIIHNKKQISNQPSIQQLIERLTTTCNRKLNQDWLRRCIGNNAFDSSISEVDTLSGNNDSEFQHFRFFHSFNKNVSTLNSFNNKSFTDDEDYICNSDSEEERKNKRIRNSNKIFYDCGLQPSKRLCITNDNSYKKKIDCQVLQNSLTNINVIEFSNDSTSTSNYDKDKDYKNINEFQQRNSDSERKITKPKKVAQNTFKSMLENISYSTCSKNPHKLTKMICSSINEYKNMNIIKNGMISTIDKFPTQNIECSHVISHSPLTRTKSSDLTDFSCVLKQLNLQTTNFSIKHKSNNKNFDQNLTTGKFNENFIKINLKKKVFVRGKKSFNWSKYKRNQWKQRKKEINLSETNLKVANIIDINNKCQETGLLASYCKHLKNDLISLDGNADIFNYSTLEGVKEIAKLNTCASIDPSNTHIKLQNISVQPKILEDKNFSEEKNFKSKININNVNLEIFKKTESLTEKLLDSQIQEVCPLYELEADHSVKDAPLEVLLALEKFGHSKFRTGQEKAIMRILSGQSTLVTLTTGSGKSLCYQLPAYMYAKKSTCITLVISPLVSLMDDQIAKMPNFLTSACLHTNQSPKEHAKLLVNLKKRKLNILLISPELIVDKEKLRVVGNILHMLPPIAFACIDEIHCISQWSHNFRPAYLMIFKVLKEKFGVKRILGLTASAKKSTVMNIVSFLKIEDGMAGVISERPVPYNLNLTVSRDEHKEKALIKLLQSEKFIKYDSIIIYCTRREECIKVAKLLRGSLEDSKSKKIDPETKISSIAEAYHAGLSAHRRKIVQVSFMKSETRIIVATVAFGMGINKLNIRSVIHFNMPASFEGYVQEIGRAGRDGHPAFCHLFLNPKEKSDEYELRRHINANGIDRHTIRRLLQKIFVPCCCIKLHSELRCQGHEVGFPIKETIKILDISEEKITTLLCYLELHPKHFIKMLPFAYINAKISCYNKESNVLKSAAESSPLLAVILNLLIKNGIYKESSSIFKFSVIDVAASIGLDSSVIKKHLKNLELISVNCKTRKPEITVNFDTLGFRVRACGDLTNEELEEALESLNQQNHLHTSTGIQQLKYISTSMRKVSFASVKECYEPHKKTYLKSEELKRIICNYFELDKPLLSVFVPLDTKLENQTCIVADIRNLIFSYRDIHFTGRSVARIFHGIQSPNYSALIWSKCRFWKAHLADDFNALCLLATKEILKIKERNI